MKTAVVIPTRNRADLAANAVRSILDQRANVAVIVSDNSTAADELDSLSAFCGKLNDPRLTYLRPPSPLPMPEHWEWALTKAIAMPDISHVIYLTDRMVFRRDTLRPLLRLSGRYPDNVISYYHDLIDDVGGKPICLHETRWSGNLLEIQSADLLESSAALDWQFWGGLPRMLNSIVPRSVINAVAQRFGNVFLSIAPDFCFAYRCLAVADSILYYDKSILLRYGENRSNGRAQCRGVVTKDHADFLANLGGKDLNYAAPVPELRNVMNTMIHEYCLVRQETNNGKFPEVDRNNYLAHAAYEFRLMEDPAFIDEMLSLLKKHADGPILQTNKSRRFPWSAPPVVTEFNSASAALEYGRANFQARDWGLFNPDFPVRIVTKWQAVVSGCANLLLNLPEHLGEQRRQARRLLDRHLLWRFR